MFRISAAPFRDRIVHHAIVNVLEPIYERRFIPDSYACRRGKGTHRAIDRAQYHSRRHAFCLNTDVVNFTGCAGTPIPHPARLDGERDWAAKTASVGWPTPTSLLVGEQERPFGSGVPDNLVHPPLEADGVRHVTNSYRLKFFPNVDHEVLVAHLARTIAPARIRQSLRCWLPTRGRSIPPASAVNYGSACGSSVGGLHGLARCLLDGAPLAFSRRCHRHRAGGGGDVRREASAVAVSRSFHRHRAGGGEVPHRPRAGGLHDWKLQAPPPAPPTPHRPRAGGLHDWKLQAPPPAPLAPHRPRAGGSHD